MSFGGSNVPELQRPRYHAYSQPIGASEYSQSSGLGYEQAAPMNQRTFTEQPHTYQVNGDASSSWTTQIPIQPNISIQNYVQMLEQELALARRRNQEYEITILQLANLLCQTPLSGNHDQGISHTFTHPQYSNPTSQFRPQFSSLSGAHGEYTQMAPTNYSRRAFGGLQHPPLSGNAPLLSSYPRPRPLPAIPRLGQNARHNSTPTSTALHPTSVIAIPQPPKPGLPYHSASMRSRSKTPAGLVISSQPNSVIAMPPSFGSKPHFTSMAPCFRISDWSVEYTGVDRTLEVKLMRTITDGQGAFRVKFSPDGQLLAIVARVGQVVTIYHVGTGSRMCQLEDLYEREDPPSTQDLSFSSNGKYLATCTEEPESTIRIWDVGKKCVRNVLKGHLHGILCLDFSPDGRLLISGSSDRTVRIWNMRDGSSRIFHNSSSDICSIRFSPDGRHLAAGSLDADLFLWDLRSRHLVASMTGHTDTVTSIVFMPNGEGLISGSWDGTLKYWNNSASTAAQISDRMGAPDDAKRKLTFVGNTAEILSVTIPPHGQWIATSSFDCTVGIWNTRTGMQQCILQAHAEKVYSIDCSPAGDYFASADWKGTVRIWNCKHLVEIEDETVKKETVIL